MKRFPTLVAALSLAAVFLAPALRAAEADEDDKPTVRGKVLNAGSRVATPDIAAASDEGARALSRMKVPEGLTVKLWAAEPMLANPVAFNFDEKGRAFVAETYRYRSSVFDIRDYMWMLEDDLALRTIEDRTAMVKRLFGAEGEKELGIEGEVVRLVADTNGDGVADKSYVYADSFNHPLDGIASGVLARRGKVWFTNIPSVWQFSGDTKAETRTEISRGYGVRFNFTGHDLHGLAWGPDGKIYFSNGDRGATVKTKEGGVISVPDSGAVFRCNPDGSQMELVMTGLRNPQSLVFTENGDLFTGDNDCDQGDEERLVHVIEGADAGWRVGYQFPPLGKDSPWFANRLWHQRHAGQPAYILPPICNIEDGPSGITYYPGTGLNESYRGNIFITHFKGAIARSGIYTYTVKPKGASYEIGDAKPFMTSALPTDVKFGPDGRLYTSDWADGWPKSKRGRIYAIADPKHENDPLVKETKALIGGDWTKRSAAELAQLLAHADWRVRLEAQFTLAERGAGSIATLAKVATAPSAKALARLHAIWGLGQLAATDQAALAAVRTLLRDSDAEVRAQALKVLGDAHLTKTWGTPSGEKHILTPDADALAAALTDPSDRVKFFAAQALAKLKHAGSAPAVLAALRANDNADATLRHALVMALAAGNNITALTAAIADRSPAVRLGVVLALRHIGSPVVAKFLADSDPLIVREAALAINDAPINDALPALASLLAKPLTDESVAFRVINAHFRLGSPAHAAALAAFAANSAAPAKLRAEALAQLALWPKPPQRDRLVGTYRPFAEKTRDRAVAADALRPLIGGLLAAGTPAVVQTATLNAMQDLEIAGATDALFAAVKDESLPGETRAAALGTLDKIKDPRLAEAVTLASASSSSTVRLAALPIAARLSPAVAAPVISNLIAKGTVTEQKAALRSLGFLRHPSADPLFADQLRQLEAGKIAPAVQLDLLNAASRRSAPEIKALLEKRTAALTTSTDPLAPHRVALEGGDAKRGEQIFRNQPTLACIRCHRAGGDGGDAGPNLAGIGAKQTREELLESIVKPNAKIAPGFDTIVVTLKSGGVAAGIVARESADLLVLRNTDNNIVEVKKTDIAKREGAPSGMPEIYGAILTPTQLRDVVEFMASLKEGVKGLDDSQPRALRGLPPVAAAAR
ncbi:MAG: HEAT repeat domain-containing protein [Opitutaceae bacterium]|nr:HEAT repeat domain-containing protein [Opitutaceae bacterium]